MKLESLTSPKRNHPADRRRDAWGASEHGGTDSTARTDKVAIPRTVLLDGQAVSAVCEEHNVGPALFYTWQKQFFENGAAAFAKDTTAEQRALERTVDELRQRLTQKDRVIAKVTEEFVKTNFQSDG